MKVRKTLIYIIVLILGGFLFSSCLSDDDTQTPAPAPTPKISKIEFEPLLMPANTTEEAEMRVSPKATVSYTDGSSKTFSLSYQLLFKSGDTDAKGNAAGQLLDRYSKPILFKDGSKRFSVQPDATAFFKRGNKYYMFQHFESSPGAVYLVDLDLDKDGKLTPVKYTNIDFSALGGTVINCSGQKSPWDTFLSAEEDYYFSAYHFDPQSAKYNAQHVNYCAKDANGNLTGDYNPPAFDPKADFKWWCHDFVKPLLTDYLDLKSTDDFNPYNYGYVVEIGLDDNGNPYIANNLKHYVLGKFTPEVAVVAPDNRTVYMLDDGNFSGMFMFVADKAKDLSSGCLYIAKVKQLSQDDTDGGEMEINWVKLGCSTDAKLNSIIHKQITMSDIFDIEDPNNCPTNFTKMYTYDTSDANQPMCIRLKDGTKGSSISPKFVDADEVRTAAAFLHPRQYGVLLGGTTEFSKGEGVTYNPDKNVFYFAISRVEGSMTKGKGTKDDQDDIRLKENRCGAVYEGTFGEAVDTQKNKISSQYVVRKLTALILGKKANVGEQGADKNFCAIDTVANPDNILYMGHNLLFIAEDSGFHYNNMLWVYNVDSKKLTRIGTVPPGAEVTGAFAHININGKKYVAFNAQHPYGESRRNAEGKTILPSAGITVESLTDAKYKGIVGYIAGLPEW